MPKKIHPWYNFDKLYSFNATINCVAGGRGIGKTYGAQIKAIRNAIRSGELFIYLRRYKDELKLAARTFFDAVQFEFPDHDFRSNGMQAEMAPVSTRGEKKRQWQLIGYFIPLSIAQQVKSVAFPKVTLIIFDEFIIEKGAVRYLPDEWTIFLNFYNTVDRSQDKTKVLMLANAVSMMNPYFLALGVEPDREGEWVSRGNGFVCVHFPDSEAFKKSVYQTAFGKFIEGTEYAAFAVDNEFPDANPTTMIGRKTGKAKYMYSLECKTGTFSVWREPHSERYVIQAKLPKQQTMLTLLPDRMSHDKMLVTTNDKILQVLRTAFRSGSVWFYSAAVRNSFSEIFKG